MFRRRRTDEDFAAEIEAHLATEADRLVGEGLTRDEALAAARRQFGSVTRTRERFYDARRFVLLDQFRQDLRYAWRGLWHSRAFVATTVLTLAVGLSLVTVVFAVFNAYVLRPFAVRDPYSLFTVGWRGQEAGGRTFRWRDYDAIRARTDLFQDAIAEVPRTVSSNGRPLSVGFVSGNYFETLGVRIALGRGLLPADARAPGAEPVAVLTDHAWTRLFDRDPGVVGREVPINGHPFTVVGIAGPEFAGMDESPRDLWAPITMEGASLDDADLFGPGQPRRIQIIARLKEGVTPERAQDSLVIEPFETRVAGRVDAVRARLGLKATPVRMTLGGFAWLTPIFAAFGLVLVAACANASNVMLARANARHREIGIRLSIGASRGRVVRQLVTEGLLIAMLAGVAGLALAAALRRLGVFLFVGMLPPTIAPRVRLVPLDFDQRVFLFAFVLAGAATVLFALLPALQATRVTLTDALRGQLTGRVRSGTLRGLLVTSQVAVSLVLLIVASTLVRNGAAIRATDIGMETAGVVSVRPNRGDNSSVKSIYEVLTADPRIGHVVVASRNPLFGDGPKVPIRQPSGLVVSSYAFVSPDYLDLLRIPIVHGRGFSSQEAQAESPVAIVSVAGARALWPGEDPLGKTLRIYIEPPGSRITVAEMTTKVLRRTSDDEAAATTFTVIGVAKDVVNGFVYQGTDPAHLYLPTSPSGSRAATLMVRGRTSAAPVDAVRSLLRSVSPDPMAFDVLPVSEMVEVQMFPMRAASLVGSLLSAVALVLSVTGLYGVLTYTFGQRTHEIGVRMALGATAGAVRRMVFRQSARFSAFGTIIGLLVGFAVMKLLSTVVRLDNVTVVDPAAFAASLALIAAAVGVASLGPAHRAARTDPTAMLRTEG